MSLLMGLLALVMAASAQADVACRALINQSQIRIPASSEDADHIYFSGHEGSDFFDATFHKSERFIYLQILTGSRSNPAHVSGTYVMNGGGLPATLSYSLNNKVLQFSCQN